MVEPVGPDPVKLFVGVLTSQPELLTQTERILVAQFGPVDYRSEFIPFNVTDYYDNEMGTGIQRAFLSFEKLIDPGNIAGIKLKTNQIEEKFADTGNRKINLDPGYLDYHKVVLASGKFGGPKVYLSHGIYADLTLRFMNGKFAPFDWGFPDFRAGLYNNIFMQIRNLYKKSMKNSSQ